MRYAGAGAQAGAGGSGVPRFAQPLVNLLTPGGGAARALPQAAAMQPEEAAKRRWGIAETLSVSARRARLAPLRAAGGAEGGAS